MCEADLSSCSYLTEGEDPVISAKDSTIRELQYDKEHLEDVNKNLQASLETVKQQLKDTLAAVDTSNVVNEQIQQLKKVNADLIAKKDELQNQLELVTSNSNESTQKLSAEITEVTQQRDEAIAALSNIEERVSKLKKERSNNRVELQEKAELLQAITEDYQKCKQQKKKLQGKLQQAAARLQEVEDANEQMSFENQRINNEMTTILSENESLKLKLDTSNQLNNETENANKQLERELEQKINIISTLESQFESQKEELQNFSDERQRILEIMQLMQSSLAAAETTVENLQRENTSLKQKAKNGAKQVQKPFATVQEFNALVMPFTGELKTKCQAIMKMPQYQPFQRIQLVLNEAAKVATSQEEEVKVTTRRAIEARSAYDNFATDQVKYQEILEALLSDLKHLVQNQDLINNCPLCKEDTEFIEFIDQKLEDITNIVQREAIKDPKYLSNDFFYTADVNKRKEAVRKLLEPCDSTFSLFCAQFLTNIFLENQLSAVTAPLQLIENMTKSGVLRGTQLSDVPTLIETLNQRVNKTTSQNKKLTKQLKKAQTQAMSLIKSENEKKTKISELSLQVDSLQNEIGVLNVKLQVANNELLLKENECGSLNQFAREIREGVEERTNDQKARTDRLEEALKSKTNECAELANLLRELEKSVDESTNSQLRRAKKNEEQLLAQIEILQTQVDDCEKQLSDRKKACKKLERQLREQYDKSVNELAMHYEEGKKNLENTIDQLKEKAKGAREMSKRLVDNMSEVEKKNATLQDDNNTLLQKLKAIQVEILTMKNTQQKEKQQQQAQLAAQLMASETRAQKTITEEKAKLSQKIEGLIETVQKQIGTFYGIDDSEFDEEAFEQTVKSAREDLNKLQYFQQEATKPLNMEN